MALFKKNFQFLFVVSILEKMVKVLAHCIGSLECYSLELKIPRKIPDDYKI